MLFTGEYDCKLDPKGRLMLPSKLKAKLAEGEETLVVLRGFEPCLTVYPLSSWEKVYEKISALNEFTEEYRNLQRNLLRGATEVDLDGQGRLLLPKSMLGHAGISHEIVAVGVANRIELWDPTTYQRFLITDPTQLSTQAEKVLGDKKNEFDIRIHRN